MSPASHAAAAYLNRQPRLQQHVARLATDLRRCTQLLHPAPPVRVRATRRHLLASLPNQRP